MSSRVQVHAEGATRVRVAPDHEVLFTCGADGFVRVYGLELDRPRRSVSVCAAPVLGVDFDRKSWKQHRKRKRDPADPRASCTRPSSLSLRGRPQEPHRG
ncbi:hypothetical protein DIPPA_24106 [Diplonema papillatum]|nr:hypothetical protein DIPPA_24106 [Diplonema papillatum]